MLSPHRIHRAHFSALETPGNTCVARFTPLLALSKQEERSTASVWSVIMISCPVLLSLTIYGVYRY